MTKREILAYASGLFDGEGCITISDAPVKSNGNEKTSRQMQLRVTVNNTHEGVIDFLRGVFAGTKTRSDHAHRANPNYQPIWHWEVISRQALSALKLMLPYLRVKRRQAEIAIQFQNHITLWHHRKTVFMHRGRITGVAPLPAHVWRQREMWKMELESINGRRGLARKLKYVHAVATTDPESPHIAGSDSLNSEDGKLGEEPSKNAPALAEVN